MSDIDIICTVTLRHLSQLWRVVVRYNVRKELLLLIVSAEAKYDGQTLQEAKISGLVYTLCSLTLEKLAANHFLTATRATSALFLIGIPERNISHLIKTTFSYVMVM